MADTAVVVEQEAPDSGSSGSGGIGGGLTITSGLLEPKSEDGDGDMMDADVSGSNVNYDSSGDGMPSSVIAVNKVLKKGIRIELLHDGDMVDIDVENQENNNSQCSTQAGTLSAASTISTTAATSNSISSASAAVGGGIHPSRKMFECDVCNMKFSNGANMRRHKMRHTGVKPYECRVCQKRFFRKDHLAEHFTTHTKTLPYHCPICNRGFQRQIAMRAHFQNEHVGQHDLVKSCPLCSYRAGSMKSLRIHFFNRHGIDLDNPGTAAGGSASLLAAAAQQGYQLDSSSLTSLGNLSNSLSVSMTTSSGAGGQTAYSDSGDSTGARSTDNATPPMHFLTPHVEISMAGEPGTSPSNGASSGCVTGGRGSGVYSPNINDHSSLTNSHNHVSHHATNSTEHRLANGTSDCPNSPQSADSNSNAPSSTHSHQLLAAAAAAAAAAASGAAAHYSTSTTTQRLGDIGESSTTTITPSISLIPIKQEPMDLDSSHNPYDSGPTSNGPGKRNCGPLNLSSHTQVQLQTATSSSLSSIIKVSPLKSLLREDLKRKLVSRGLSSGSGGGGRNSRGMMSSPPNGTADMCSTPNLPTSLSASLSSCADNNLHTNGTITSTGPEQPSDSSTTLWVRSSTSAKRAAALLAIGLQCAFCGIGFPDQTLYFLHKGCHSDANPWKCNICGEQCCNVYEFNSHLLSKSHQ